MKKRKAYRNRDPVYDPTADIYLCGVSGERPSKSNPGSMMRELNVCLDNIDAPQSGRSFVDVSMDNYKENSWPNRIIVLQKGYIIYGKGVTRKNKEGDIYFDADHFEPLMVYDETGKPLDDNASPISTNNNFSKHFEYESKK